MLKDIYERVGMPSSDESKAVLKSLRDHGVVAEETDDLECRMKLIKFGQTVPSENCRWLVYNSSDEKAVYVFLRYRDVAPGPVRPSLISLKFDLAKYQGSALASNLGLDEACDLFNRAMTVLTGRRGVLQTDNYSHN